MGKLSTHNVVLIMEVLKVNITSICAFPLHAQISVQRKIFEFGASHFNVRPVKAVTVISDNYVRFKFLCKQCFKTLPLRAQKDNLHTWMCIRKRRRRDSSSASFITWKGPD